MGQNQSSQLYKKVQQNQTLLPNFLGLEASTPILAFDTKILGAPVTEVFYVKLLSSGCKSQIGKVIRSCIWDNFDKTQMLSAAFNLIKTFLCHLVSIIASL